MCVFIPAVPITKLFAWGEGIVEDYDYELFIHGNVGIRRKTQRRIHADARRGHVLLGVDSCVFFRVTPVP